MVKLTISQFCHLYAEPTDEVRVYGVDQGEVLMQCTFHEAGYSAFANLEVGGFIVEDGLVCINVDCGGDQR